MKASQLAAGMVDVASLTAAERAEIAQCRSLAGIVPLLSAMKEWAHAVQLTGGQVLQAAQAWAARNTQECRSAKVSHVLEEFLKAKTAAGKNVASDHRSTFQRIHRDLGELSIASISSTQLDVWLSQWPNPITRNTRRKRIVSLWRWAQRKAYLPRDAKTEAEMTDAAHEPAPVVGIISVETWRRLLAFFRKAHPELLAPLVLAGFCGLRRTEIHGQEWSDIGLDLKNLRVTYAKRGTPARRMVPLCKAAVEWLSLCDAEGPLVCATLAVDGIRRIAREAGFELPENCFRHSFISHKVAGCGDIARVSLEAGNSPKEINRHYRELVSPSEGCAWFDSYPDPPVRLGPVLWADCRALTNALKEAQ